VNLGAGGAEEARDAGTNAPACARDEGNAPVKAKQ
jgi:hypothetical protein